MTTSTFDDISAMVEGRLECLEEAELRFQEELKKERKERKEEVFHFQEELKKERKEWKEECEILREGLRHRGLPVRASDDTHIPQVSFPSRTDLVDDVIHDPPPAVDRRGATLGKDLCRSWGACSVSGGTLR